MRPFLLAALLALPVPVPAQAPLPQAAPLSASAASPPPTAGPPASLLDDLIGKTQILGITKQDGTRYLCRISSGDHGMYVAQTFHFAGPPKVETRTTTPAAQRVAHTSMVLVGSRLNLHWAQRKTYTTVPGGTTRTTKAKTDTTIPDDRAVRLLLAGVAGSLHAPRELYGPRDLFAASDVKYLQALSPPAAAPKAAGRTASALSGSAAPVFQPSASQSSNWTMTLLWPADASALRAERKLAHKKRQKPALKRFL